MRYFVRALLIAALVLLAMGCDKKKEEGGEGAKPAGPAKEDFSSWSSQQKALKMGTKISLAAMGYARGATEPAMNLYGEANELAGMLGVGEFPAFPEVTGDGPADDAATLHYLLAEVGDAIGPKLSDVGAAEAALFEFGLKSNLIIMLYIPGDWEDPQSIPMSIMGVLERTLLAAGFSEIDVNFELMTLLAARDFDQVKDAVAVLQDSVMRKVGK